jgi:hypothetical protein
MGRSDADRKEADRLYAPLKAASPVSTALGESLPYVAAGGLAGAGRSLLGAAARQGAAGAAIGGAMEGDAQERAKRAAIEGGIGAAGGALFGIPGAIAARATRPEVAMMREAGVVPTVGQTLGGIPSKMEEAMGSLPVVGQLVDYARQRARNEFNAGAINRSLGAIAGTPGVERVASKQAGHEGIGIAQQGVNAAYDAARALAPGGLPFDDVARQELSTLRGMMGRSSKDTEQAFNRFLGRNFDRKLAGYPGIETRSFKELDADIAGKIRQSGNNQELKDAFTELRRILQSSAGRANPEYLAAQKKADTAAAMLMRVENAANRGVNNEGIFTPGQLNMAVRQMDKTSRKRAVARGDALLQDYAKAGQSVLGDVVPNSGTPLRTMMTGGALAGSYIEPSILAASLAALMGSSRASQRAMNATLRSGSVVPSYAGQIFQGPLGGN